MRYDYNKLKSVTYMVEGGEDGKQSFKYVIDNDIIKYYFSQYYDEEQEFHYTLTPEIFKKYISEFNCETWRKSYKGVKANKEDVIWSLKLEFEDGVVFTSSGEYDYPETWDEFHCAMFSLEKNWVMLVDDVLDKFEITLSKKVKSKDSLKYRTIKETYSIDRGTSTISLTTNNPTEINMIFKESDDLINTLLMYLLDCELGDKNIKINGISYSAELVYRDCTYEKIGGKYSRLGMIDGWCEILNFIIEFLNVRHVSTDYLLLPDFEYDLLPNEVMYLSVLFDDYSENLYYYKTTDTTIKAADYVYVPTGKDNRRTLAFVEKVEIYDKKDVPLPLNKTKSILGKAED